MIGKLLGHSQAATTERYAHLADSPVAIAASSVADRIDGLMRSNQVSREEQAPASDSAE